MKKCLPFLTVLLLTVISVVAFGQEKARHDKEKANAAKVDHRIDNMGYWNRIAREGLVPLNPMVNVPPAIYTGSEIRAFSSITEDSPDVPVAPDNTTQSENSVFVHPEDNQHVINSNNSGQNPLGSFYGANALETEDGSQTWGGEVEGAGGSNSGDPVALIGNNGWFYIGFIDNGYGQTVAVSQNQGTSWTTYQVASGGGSILDKNHLWIDNCPTSPYNGNLYDAWTDFTGGPFDSEIALSHSTNGGSLWSPVIEVSSGANAGSWCQGVNITTGPDGEAYVIFAVYDYSYPSDENAIGMARSFDGGTTWLPAMRIIDNIRGIRATGISKNMRNNAFPVATADISGGEYDGNIYVVWTNVGVPGINTGSDIDIYMIRSEDQGVTWSTPVRVNQDPAGLGRQHYFPWITCDPSNGILSVVFYDDRNVGGAQCEVYCANSYDGGDTWEDFKVSDVAFTPSPVPGLADLYMGDYLGINAQGGWVYPIWADTRTGNVNSYCSPYQTNPLSRPENLTLSLNEETGQVDLLWSYLEAPGFSYFKIYRENDSIGMTMDTTYIDQLPTYGIYKYKVTAIYAGTDESNPAQASIQWGNAHISVSPLEITETLMPETSVTRYVTVSNVGELEMNYQITAFIPSQADGGNRAYCPASGGCDEYISRVQIGTIDQSSDCAGYEDYTALSAMVSIGKSYEITITNGTPLYSNDVCALWVDWNEDETFSTDEKITVNGTPGIGPYTATIIPPMDIQSGPFRLRTRISYIYEPEPCGTTTYGEVEDYTLLRSWLLIDPLQGTIQSGENQQIAVTLDATGMAFGTYTAELRINSNDPDYPQVIVPITMIVAEMSVNVTTDHHSVCLGESAQLTAEVIGGSGTYTYLWTSDPPGFTSSEANPIITPDVTTTYYVEVFDGTITVNDEITVVVLPLPLITLGDDASVCQGDSFILDAGAGFKSYLWNTGDTTQTITVTQAGEYWVQVTNQFNCFASDTMEFTIDPLPFVSLGNDTTLCYYHELYLDAGNPGSTYLWSTGETTQTIMVDTTGMVQGAKEIWIEVTTAKNCTSTDNLNINFIECTGIDENSGMNIAVYPNPGEGRFTVQLNNKQTFTGDLKVMNSSGLMVFEKKQMEILPGDQVDLDLSTLPNGVYLLQVTGKPGTYRTQVIISR